MLTLETKITNLNQVGKTTASRLKKLGLENISDLIFYFPYRYDNFGDTIKIKDLIPGALANIIGQVDLIQNRRSFKRKMSITEALIKDETETIKVVWFNQPFLTKTLKVGDYVSLSGKVIDNYGQFSLSSPVYEKIKIEDQKLIHTAGLTPLYSTTANLTQKQIRFLIKQAVDSAPLIKDWLPEKIKTNLKLLDLDKALEKIHFPKNEDDLRLAKQRLSFAELFLRQLKGAIIKNQIKSSQTDSSPFNQTAIKKFVDNLKFKLTDDQKKAAWEILQDMEKPTPMSRLLEGDVGSGKTLVAIIALLNTALNKFQGALMVPTEILAEQHFETISKLLVDFPIKIGLITHSKRFTNYEPEQKKNKKLKTEDITLECDIIIGTQALIQEKVKFNNLNLIIIDEQHRFGVEQRHKLLKIKTATPHFLSMTATPIPRSLALAIYGDLDVSVIKTKPANRLPIITKLVEEDKRSQAYDFIRTEIKTGRQVFVVCPLIDPSDKLGVKSVTEEFERLDKNIFPDLKIGLLHGKLKPAEKNQIMQEFLDNKIKILVSTSVIEVGIDVPNATIMIIEGAERFGLAQLHQFRGRVGRDKYQSYCFLFSNLPNPKRLEALVKYQDGFLLAQEDLKNRGSGEIYGTVQSGFPELKIASLFDYALIKQAQEAAQAILSEDPELNKYPLLKKELGDWEKVTYSD